jgi:precorrin-2 dehydrogenase/sirohydrochlorin ferrochelatase
MSEVVYPIALDLRGKRCLVVGGGVIADGKLDALLAAGASVTLVSPEVLPRVARFAADDQIALHLRPYEPADLVGAFLVIAATDDRAINARIAAEARARGILVNAVDDIPNCDFFAVAIVRRGDLQLSISTNGRSPAFARWLRERFDRELPADYGDLLDLLGDARERLKGSGPIPAYEAWRDAIDDDLIGALRDGGRDAAGDRLVRRLEGARAGASDNRGEQHG